MIPEQDTRPTTTLKNEDGLIISIREPYARSTRQSINLVFKKGDDAYGVILSAEDAKEFATTLKQIAERIITELPALEKGA